jgi:hypothetical protein
MGERCSQMGGGALAHGWAAAGRRARGVIGRGGGAVTHGWEVVPSLLDGRRQVGGRAATLGGEEDGRWRYAGTIESGASAARFGSKLIGMNRWWDPHVSHIQANENGVGGRCRWLFRSEGGKTEQVG